jgi:putative transposase
MDGSISLRSFERKALLRHFRSAATHEERLRAHILLLLDDGFTWAVIASVLFTSSSTINRWQRRFQDEGLDAVLHATGRQRRSRFSTFWIAMVIHWVTTTTPRDFGMVRSRWTCGTIVWLLRHDHGVTVSRETVRRWLHHEGMVYRRPRPVLGPKDPQRAAKLRKIKALLASLPSNEVAVFQDEVDVNTNPKIGNMWMKRGQQAEVVTPGNNTKRYFAGSLNWRTGQLILTAGLKRNAELFLAHLDELRRCLRRYNVIHVICDNAAFHTPQRCKAVREYLAKWGHRIQLHFLPTYSPDTNPIERVWWHLHEEITRNHRCADMDELLDLVFEWLFAGSHFEIETTIYTTRLAA